MSSGKNSRMSVNSHGTGRKSSNSTSSKGTAAVSNPVQEKEEGYKRINETLEKKTSYLVTEAENILKESKLLLDKTGTDKVDREFDVAKFNAESFDSRDIINRFLQENESRGGRDAELDEPVDADVLEILRGAAGGREAGTGLAGKESDYVSSPFDDLNKNNQTRILKAKLKVMQEELDEVKRELGKKESDLMKLTKQANEQSEELAKKTRLIATLKADGKKYDSDFEQLRAKSETQEAQLSAARSETEHLKAELKKSQQEHQLSDQKYHRALEELDKYKAQAQKNQENSKETSIMERRRLEEYQAENKRLKKQKFELVQAFKRQLKLVDVIKKQQMHLEASCALDLAKDEFINSLDIDK